MEAKDTGVIMVFGFILLKNREKNNKWHPGKYIPPDAENLKK
jgi:hypothetical protein